MTVENKIIFGLDDIKALLIECKICHGRIAYRPGKIRTIPGTCPQCQSDWRPREGYMQAPNLVFDNFVVAVQKIAESLKDEAIGFKLLFELDAPKP
jgi:hypothetical protein